MTETAEDLILFLNSSPTPFHAVSECSRRLMNAGFMQLKEEDYWEIETGDRFFVTRQDSSIVAFQVGSSGPEDNGFRIIGAHTDSPNLRIRPDAELKNDGYSQLAIEPYGGVLLHTWLDRDLSLAGRVFFEAEGKSTYALINVKRPILRVPSLAIHLERDVNKKGLSLNPEKHLFPILGLENCSRLTDLVGEEILKGEESLKSVDRIHAYDLMAYDVQPAEIMGPNNDFISSGRLDNLSSCHAGLTSLIESSLEGESSFTRVVALFDHEEVGSVSSRGADSTFLEDVLNRVVSSTSKSSHQHFARSFARSTAISADMSHGVHPNYPDKHDRNHRPVLGSGPVIKTNVNQAYATDSETASMFSRLCREVGVQPQAFSSRNDLACGSTIGAITSARLGIRTVDVGNSMLSMHSCREFASSHDVEPIVRVFTKFFKNP